VKELRLAGVSDMAAGNMFLPGFVKQFNDPKQGNTAVTQRTRLIGAGLKQTSQTDPATERMSCFYLVYNG
jgi:hypothetical protein